MPITQWEWTSWSADLGWMSGTYWQDLGLSSERMAWKVPCHQLNWVKLGDLLRIFCLFHPAVHFKLKDLNTLFYWQFWISVYSCSIVMIFCGLINVNSRAEQASTCVKISTSEEVMVLMYHTCTLMVITHCNAVVIQALSFWFCALLFAAAVVLWTTDIAIHKLELCLRNCWVWVSVPPGPPFLFFSYLF